jgi:hypothetical protein
VAILSYLCVRSVWARRKRLAAQNFGRTRSDGRTTFGLTLVAIVFILSTLNIAAEVVSAVQAFVDNRLYPGGATAWSSASASTAASQISNICCILLAFVSDGLLVSAA